MATGDYVQVSIADTGSGMPDDVIARAFDPFFTTKEIGQGTGLGLSMIYGFAKQSGGHVQLASQVGRGTTVTLYLPRAENDGKQPGTALGIEAPCGQGEVVLIVEDDETVRLLITEVLEDLGYRYLEAPDARVAMASLETGQPIDLLIIDVGLPKSMSAFQI